MRAAKLVGLIGCNSVTRHDAVVSVRAGFTNRELSDLWPTQGAWLLQEQRAGLFSHLFRRPPQVMDREITIVGGGLAGLTLGIGLRQNSVPVTVWESGHYPRHRVCGEFISGRGQDSLARLGLLELLKNAGAIPARTAAFFSEKISSPARELLLPAICLSRHVLDNLLARELARLGGRLREGERWREADFAEGVVRASRRRLQAVEAGWRWFGLKAHAREVELTASGNPRFALGLCGDLPPGE